MIVIPPPPPPTSAGESGFVSLRDYFAAAALTGFLVNMSPEETFGAVARDAYDAADVMLEARERKE